MSCLRYIATALALLGLWLQLLAPASAMGMQRQSQLTFGKICHTAAAGHDRRDGKDTPASHGDTCDHCPLCHATAGGLPGDGQPSFTLFDYPASSPLRWASVVSRGGTLDPEALPQPRGPPALV